MIYFLHTIPYGSQNKLRALSHQIDETGNLVNDLLNIQANSEMRSSYPIGTVFATEKLILNSKNGTQYYAAGAIFPVGLELDKYIDTSHCPSMEMQNAYIKYCNDMQNATSEPTTENKKVPIGSLRERLLKKCPKPSTSKDGFFIKDKDWHVILRNISQKINTMMVGPTGTGKTELVMLAAKSLGLECSIFDMGSMYDPISGMLGVHRLQKGGESVFDYAEFTKAVSKPGVVLLDELSRAPVTTLNILFPCLDSRKTLPVEMAGGDSLRSIKVHPECVFFATANIGAEYTGTMSMDRALVDRFFPLELDYIPEDEEKKLLIQRYSIKNADAKNISSVANNVRSLFKKGEIGTTISTRHTLSAASLVADGWTALEAMEMVFLPMFEGTTAEGERSVISKIILSN